MMCFHVVAFHRIDAFCNGLLQVLIATGYTISLSRGPVVYVLAALTMLAFAVTSLDSATKTLVNDSFSLIERVKPNNNISKNKLLSIVTYSTMAILGVLNIVLLITGFPRVFTILSCLIFVPFFVRAIIYAIRFALGKLDFSKTGTLTEEEYKCVIEGGSLNKSEEHTANSVQETEKCDAE